MTQLPYPPLNNNDGDEGGVIAGVGTVDKGIAIKEEKGSSSVAKETDAAMTTAHPGTTLAVSRLWKPKVDALELIQQRLHAIQARTKEQQALISLQLQEASRREEALQKLLQGIIALQHRPPAVTKEA
ncbi:hypothetical protein MVEG_09297 [Podila verticillata NRRL 6337]|nr:hypothetical protein MVEG_09297 [Podila verticillata NRRL 6337]